MTLQREEAMRMLALARRDAAAMQVLAASSAVSVASVGFHAQQAIEKSLKALILEHGGLPKRTHDLAELANVATELGVVLPAPLLKLQAISRFAVEFRYDDPGDFPMSGEAIVEVALSVLDGCAALLLSRG